MRSLSRRSDPATITISFFGDRAQLLHGVWSSGKVRLRRLLESFHEHFLRQAPVGPHRDLDLEEAKWIANLIHADILDAGTRPKIVGPSGTLPDPLV